MPPSPVVSLARLREAIRSRVADAGLRPIAREVGITHRGLELFLGGAKPQPKTLAKLLQWYGEHLTAQEGPPIAESDALLVLLRPLPAGARPHARVRTLEFLDKLYAEAGVPLPPSLGGDPDRGT